MASGGGSGGPPPGFLKNLQENKLKSFSIGSFGNRGLTRKQQEDLKKKQDEDEVGKVYQEFVSTFEDSGSSKVNKTWVKAGTFNAGNRKEDTAGKGQLYNPKSRIEMNKAQDKLPTLGGEKPKRPEKPGKKKQQEKKKSNLEIFKEELKAMQEEREERHRVKNMIRSGERPPSSSQSSGDRSGRSNNAGESAYNDRLGLEGSHDNGDPNTTNLYLGNLSPRLTEQQMLELFGKFGPLASIKIMWPRTEDEKSRGRNCGFVAYMSRIDGERALKNLSGVKIDGHEMRMGWGKPVPLPLHPIYVPPPLLKYSMPPPPSGLPFNCQPNSQKDAEAWGVGQGPIPYPQNPEDQQDFEKLVYRSIVKVVMPTDRTVLCLINRMVEFVIREGPMFEAMIMNREINNPNFTFLFENKSPEHIYYRWRMYSLLQGDSKDNWNMSEFSMFKGGSVWKPPLVNLYTGGMPDDLINEDGSAITIEDESKGKNGVTVEKKGAKKGLSNSQRDRLENMLRNLYPDRNPLAETMVWCMDHADAWEEIVECVSEALSIMQTPAAKKVARLYLISDILHNCSIKGVPNVSYYRQGFQAKLPEIFGDMNAYYTAIDSRIKAEAFKQRVMNCFRAWEDWALYPMDFLIKLQNIFLGLVSSADDGKNGDGKKSEDDKTNSEDDDDVDGMPLDGAALLKSANAKKGRVGETPRSDLRNNSDDSDVDGSPIRGLMSTPTAMKKPLASATPGAGFVPSKWETVNPEEVQAQAITSKWEMFDQENGDEGPAKKRSKKGITEPDDDDSDDIDGVPMNDSQLDDRLSEGRRARLRDIELQVMQYQDELESGKTKVKAGWTISEQVEQFRKRLLKPSVINVSSSAPSRGGRDLSPDTDNSRTPRGRGGGQETDEESAKGSHSSRRKKKSKRSRRSSSSSDSSSRSRSRSRERKSGRKRSRSRKRGKRSPSSSSDDGRSKRKSTSSSSKRARRSRSRSPKRHKKKSRR